MIKKTIRKIIKLETYEDWLVGFLKFFMKRNPVVLINKDFNQKHPYLSASTSLVLILTMILAGVWWIFFRNTQPAAAWWNDTWGYRREIPITYSGSENLTEYQVLIDDLDTATLISGGKMQDNCDDIRFTDLNGNLLNYSIVGNTCNTSETKIWVKTNKIPASDTKIYLYYGKSTAEAYQSERKTFSYSEEKTVGYVLNDSTANFDLISLEGGNSITHNGTNLILNKGQVSAVTTSATSPVSAKKLFNMSTEEYDTVVPISWASTEFVYRNRSSSYSTYFYLISPWGTATVNVYINGSLCGTSRTVTDSGLKITDCGGAASDVFRISSDIPILVNKSIASADPYPMYPATTEALYGWDSTIDSIGSGPNGSNYSWIDSGMTSSTSGSLVADTGTTLGSDGGSLYSGDTVKVQSSDYGIGASSTGDGDGGDGTTFLPKLEFGTKAGSPYATDFVAIVSDQAVTCSTYKSDGTLVGTQQLSSANSEVYELGETNFGIGDSDIYIDQAWYVECDKPAMFVSQNSDDEQNMWSYPMMRQFTYPTPTVGTPTSEEKSKGPVGYWSFDEGYGTTANDGSGKGNDGTIMGATWQTEDQCVSGKCLRFDGEGDWTNQGNSEILDFPTNDFTVSLWMKSNVTPYYEADPDYYATAAAVLDKGTGGLVDGYGVWFTKDNEINFVSDREGSGRRDLKSDRRLNLNEWYHVVIQRKDDVKYIFINGNQDDNTSNVTGEEWSDSTRNLFFGKHDVDTNVTTPDGSFQYFNGFIDEVKIYNYARTEDEIKQDYNAGLSGLKSAKGTSASIGDSSPKWMSEGLVGYWKMDESSWNGTSGEVIDASGNGNHGTAGLNTVNGSGKFGNGGNFDGVDDYVKIDDVFVTSPSALTISSWIKKNGDGGTYECALHQSVNTSIGSSSYWMGVQDSTDNIVATIGSNTGVGWSAGLTTVKAEVGEWNHVLASWDGNIVKIYINGEYIKEYSLTSYSNLTTPTRFGASSDGTSYQFNGSVDEMRIYNRALSPQEVKELYEYAPGPVLHLKMDEKSGTTAYDSSGNGSVLNLTNTSWNENGKFGSSLEYNGSSSTSSIADNEYISLTTTGTIEAWIKSDREYPSDDGTTKFRNIVNKWTTGSCSSSGDGYFLDWNGTNASASFRGYVCNGTNYQGATYSTTLISDVWYHVTYSWDGSYHRLYLNGNLVGTPVAQTINNQDDVGFLRIGDGFGGGSSYRWDGQIDDVKIYNYARTPKQIVEDMNAGHPAGGSPVGSQVSYWKFDEGFGTTAYDSITSSGNNGTINGASWTNKGRFGKALSFDGSDDYVGIAQEEFSDSDPWSISSWIYQTGNKGFEFWIGDISSSSMGINMDDISGRVQFRDKDGVYYSWNVGFDYKNNWHHFVWSSNGNNSIELFVDGISYGSISAPGQFYIDGIGRGYSTSDWNFTGSIDEVKIYNYALTEEEVKKDYNQGKSLVMGSKGTESDGVTSSQSADREYCVPGDTSTCDPPIAEWKFDEMTGTTAYDTSGNGNDGTLTNGPTWTGLGKKGSALNFNGSSKRVSIDSPVGQSGYMTASLWYKRSESDSSGTWRTLLGDKTNNIHHLISNSSSRNLGIWDGGWRDFGYNPPDDGEWHHYEIVYNSGVNATLYVDGVYENQITTSLNLSTYPIGSIGNWSGGSYWAGPIDDVKIYSYARTPAQIAWDYNRGKPVGWWKMDEGEGSTVYDHSGNGNHGTMTNMSSEDWVDGKVNGALDFDGDNDYVDLGDETEFDIEETITVSAWVKLESFSAYDTIVCKTYSSASVSGHSYFLGFASTRKPRFFAGYDLSANDEIGLGEWHHIVGVRDGSYHRLYVDGIEVKSAANAGSIRVSSQNLTLGIRDYNSSYSYPLNGLIDDVRIYNYALTAEQIKNIYNGGAVNYR